MSIDLKIKRTFYLYNLEKICILLSASTCLAVLPSKVWPSFTERARKPHPSGKALFWLVNSLNFLPKCIVSANQRMPFRVRACKPCPLTPHARWLCCWNQYVLALFCLYTSISSKIPLPTCMCISILLYCAKQQ